MSVRWVRVGEMLNRRRNAVAVDASTTYPMFGVRNRGKGAFDAGKLKGSDTKYKRLHRAVSGDVVYLKLGAWEGAFGAITEDLDGHHASGEFVLYEPDNHTTDRTFVHQLILWKSLDGKTGAKSTGTNVRRRRLDPTDFESTLVPLPDLTEQRRVAARLDTVARAVTYSSGADVLASSKQVVWQQGAGESPEAPLGSVVHQTSRSRRVDQDATYRMLGVRWYGAGPFVRETVTGADLKAKTIYDVKAGDIIYNRLFAWKGSFGLIGPGLASATVSNEFPTFTAHEDRISAGYIHAWLQRPEVWSVVEQQSTGSTPTSRNRFSIDNFLRLSIPLPDLAEQRRVVERLDAIDRVQDAMRRRDALAAALLPAARNEEFSRLVAQAG